MQETSHSLLAELCVDSPLAWTELDRLYRPLIKSWLSRFTLQPNDIDDLTQDVLSLVFKDIRNFHHHGNTGSFRAWLRTITVNVMRNFLRKRKELAGGSKRIHELISQLEDPNSQLSGQFDFEHDQIVASRVLELAEDHFESTTMAIFQHHVLENHTVADTAAQFQITSANVYKIKSRVLRKLRELAADLIDESAIF